MRIKNLFPVSLATLAVISLGACSNTPDRNNDGIDPLTQAVIKGPVVKTVAKPIAEPAVVDGKKYPVATPSVTPDVVVSPHKPYNLVGVKNYKSGDKVRDPYTKKIFMVP